MSGLARTRHIRPSELADLDVSQFDLFLRIDDGVALEWPEKCAPSACWLIDTHMDFPSRLAEARLFDFVFAAQRDGAELLRKHGVSQAEWLPLACDPAVHQHLEVAREWEIGFVGNVHAPERRDLIALLRGHYPRSFFGHAYGEELARVYSASDFAFNRSVKNDINMRVFEALSCRAPLITNDLAANGQSELFRDGVHLVTYVDREELLEKVAFYLRRPAVSKKIAQLGHDEVLKLHTYRHRMERVLDRVFGRKAQRASGGVANAITDERALCDCIDIGIKSFLRPKALLRLLRSIRTYYPSVTITVCDDGGLSQSRDDESRNCMTIIDSDPHTTLVELPFDSGVSAGRNALVERTSRSYILFLDDDFVFTADTRLARMLGRMEEDSTLGVVAGQCIDVAGGARTVRASRGSLRVVESVLNHDTQLSEEALLCHTDYFPTFALVRREVFREGVQWRGGIGGEHYDFCLQIKHSRWKAAIDSSVVIEHHLHPEALPGYDERRFNYHKAQQWLLNTWGLERLVQNGNIVCERTSVPALVVNTDVDATVNQNVKGFQDVSYFDFARADVMELVPRSARRILDVGCGAGRLGEAIKARQVAEVVGLERDRRAAAIAARRLDQVHCVDVETWDWPTKDELYDCVIAADVLEHLRDPEAVLISLRQHLTSDGTLVTSLPNVRNRSVISALLEGNWTYETAGLLDRTHLRFFTRREIEKLLHRCGFEVASWRTKPDDGFEVWQSAGRTNTIQIGNLRIDGIQMSDAEEFYAYQFLIAATPSPQPNYGTTSIIILTHNQLACTRACLNSISIRTDEPYELIVVDNGSTDGTRDYLRGLSGVRLIENDRNVGFPAGVNQGLRLATGEQILLLNNDTVVTTGWLRRMLDCLYSNKEIGLVGPVTNNISGVQCVPAAYDDLGLLDGYAWEWSKTHRGQQMPTERLVGFCLLARRELVDRIGGLDERFGLGTYEDDDYCRRAIGAGYRCMVAVDSFIHHFGSQTFAANNIDAQQLLSRNKALFDEKWQNAEGATLSSETAHSEPRESPHRVRLRCEPTPTGAIRLKRSVPKVSLCMIVRNNEKTLDDCLASIQPWVDEMIVVDTGSTDRTSEIAESYGAKVFAIPWPDSFAIARNESLRRASGEWIFWMDSDDTISRENGQRLRELLSSNHPENVLGFIMQVHCPNHGSDGACDATIVDHIKLFRNRPDLRFEGRIHEQVMPAIRRAGGEVIWTDVFVEHSGSDQSPAGRSAKQQRDLRLLAMESAEHPNSSFVNFNLGMTYADMDDHETASTYLARSIELSESGESHLRKAYALLVASHCHLGRFEEARRICFRGLEHFPHDTELLFRKGIVAHQLGDLDQSEMAYRMVLETEEPRHFNSIDRGLRGYKTRHNLALVLEARHKLELAEEQWRLVVQEVPNYRLGWRGLIANLLAQGKTTQASDELGRTPLGLECDVFAMRAQVAMALGDLVEARRHLESGLAQDARNAEILDHLCRLLFEFGEPKEAEPYLRRLVSLESNNPSRWHNLGSNCLRLSKPREAVDAFTNAIRLRNVPSISHLYLGFALEELGDVVGARTAWATASEVQGDDGTAIGDWRLKGVRC